MQAADRYLPYYDGDVLQGEIPFEEVVKLSQKRLAILKGLDTMDLDMNSRDRYAQIIRDLRAAELYGIQNTEEKKRDILSHYFLRLAYCRNKDLRDWFVRQENFIFRARLDDLKSINASRSSELLVKELEKLKAKHGEKLCPVERVFHTPQKENKDLKRIEAYYRSYIEESELDLSRGLLRVPFEYVPRLVSNRDVLLLDGYGYLPLEKAEILIELFFKRHLDDVSKKTKKILPYLEETNECLAEYLDKIDNLFLCGKDYTKISMQRQAKINLADIDIYAANHYPLCMREMHKQVRQNHHLKHTGRVQLGLFLKGIGVSLEDAMKFWRTEFTKKMPNDKFEKNYSYTIRHSFGKEGKRTDYTPWSCSRIIVEGAPTADQVHGCPFKEYNERHLRRIFMEFQLPNHQIEEIIDKTKGKHYQVACRQFFLATHPNAKDADDVGIHPNGYFEASLNANNANAQTNDRNQNGKYSNNNKNRLSQIN